MFVFKRPKFPPTLSLKSSSGMFLTSFSCDVRFSSSSSALCSDICKAFDELCQHLLQQYLIWMAQCLAPDMANSLFHSVPALMKGSEMLQISSPAVVRWLFSQKEGQRFDRSDFFYIISFLTQPLTSMVNMELEEEQKPESSCTPPSAQLANGRQQHGLHCRAGKV